MSCWVVPALAAEFWAIPLPQVLEKMRRGEIPSKTEYGFSLVDIAPHSPRMQSPNEPHPPTFVPAPVVEEPMPATPAAKPAVAVMHEEDETAGDYEEGTLSWQASRQAASRLRRSPRERLAQAA